MKITKPQALAIAAAAVLLVIALYFAFSSKDHAAPPAPKPAETAINDQLPTEPPKPPYGTQPSEADKLNVMTYNKGLYKVDMQDFETAALANRFDFITDAIKPVQGPYEDDEFLPEIAPYIKLANIVIPSKNLDLVIVHNIYPTGHWCDRGFCVYQVYIKHNGKYESYKNMMVKPPTYLQVDDKSISLVVCDTRQGYRQWRLDDGALDKPIPMDAPGHFAPVGIYKHDQLQPCP